MLRVLKAAIGYNPIPFDANKLSLIGHWAYKKKLWFPDSSVERAMDFIHPYIGSYFKNWSGRVFIGGTVGSSILHLHTANEKNIGQVLLTTAIVAPIGGAIWVPWFPIVTIASAITSPITMISLYNGSMTGKDIYDRFFYIPLTVPSSAIMSIL